MQKPNNTAKANRFLGSETFLILPFFNTIFVYNPIGQFWVSISPIRMGNTGKYFTNKALGKLSQLVICIIFITTAADSFSLL